MKAPSLSDIWLYRITHFQNLPHILRHGLTCQNHKEADPGYISIGDASLIGKRNAINVPVHPHGNLQDYVSFYFGPHSPMLLSILQGYGGVTKRPQGEIIYLVTRLDVLIQHKLPFVTTNGHARAEITSFYESVSGLDEIPWDVVKEKNWGNNAHDRDRKRRKQAELLVWEKVPVECVKAVLIYGEERRNFVEEEVKNAGLEIGVHKDQSGKWFY